MEVSGGADVESATTAGRAIKGGSVNGTSISVGTDAFPASLALSLESFLLDF